MKRAYLLLVVLSALALTPSLADARHRWHHHGHHHHFGGGGAYRHWHHHGHWHGHRHWGGYGGWGYGGWGYRPWGGGVNISIGLGARYYGGWGYPANYGYGWGYQPFYGYGGYLHSNFYRPYAYGRAYYPSLWDYYDLNPPLYYYRSPAFYYQQIYTDPWYGYGGGYYFGSTPTVNINRLVVIKRAAEPVRVEPAVVREAPKVVSRPARVDGLAKARQSIRLGDAAFREGRYVTALTRYRTAAEAARDLPEPHFRKGHAYLANGQYDLAAASFRKALQLDPRADREGFKLDDLYGAGSVAKNVHFENLAAAALMREDSSDAYFLLGLMLHFSGEGDRAEKFFVKAASLSPDLKELAAALLPAADAVAPVSLEADDEI